MQVTMKKFSKLHGFIWKQFRIKLIVNAIEAKQTNTYNAAQLRATVAFAQFGAAGLNKKIHVI